MSQPYPDFHSRSASSFLDKDWTRQYTPGRRWRYAYLNLHTVPLPPQETSSMRIAPAITLSSDQQATLEQWAHRSLPAGVVERARIVLLAAESRQNKQIAR